MDINKYLSDVESIANELHYKYPFISKEDLISEGYVGLCIANNTYNIKKGDERLWCKIKIRYAMLDYIRNESKQITGIYPTENEKLNMVKDEKDYYLSEEINDVLKLNLTDEEYKIVIMKICGYTFEEIGKEKSISKVAVFKKYNKAIDKVKEILL